jgi:hypothetical protein
MFLKIGVYTQIFFVLYPSRQDKKPSVFGFEVNPFEWLYYWDHFSISLIVFRKSSSLVIQKLKEY